MCRRNQFWGLAALCFGLGLLAGCWLEADGVRNICGIGCMAVGILIIQKK